MNLQSTYPDFDAVTVASLELREEPEEVVAVSSPDVVLPDDHTERRASRQLPTLTQERQFRLKQEH